MPIWLIVVLVIAALAAVFGAVSLLGARYLLEHHFRRSQTPPDRIIAAATASMEKGKYRDFVPAVREGIELFRTGPHEDVYLTSHDGLRLHATLHITPGAKCTAVLVHGYKSYAPYDFSLGGQWYLRHGWNVLLVDQRCHGESDGAYITFGMQERYDVRDFCWYLARRFGDAHGIYLAGISMGATTVLLAAALPDMPKTLVGVAADCGYTSMEDEFRHVMKGMRLPRFPFLPLAEKMCRRRLGFGFSDVSTVTEVQKICVPVFFVHGEGDDFVPAECTRRAYAACPGPKQLLLVKNAPHAISYLEDMEGYNAALAAFVSSLQLPYDP